MNIDKAELFKAFMASPALESVKESIYGNDGWINAPDRRERIEEAAENGEEGSTHAEIIADYYDALPQFLEDCASEIERVIIKEIEEIEEWHEQNGSLHRQVGY